MKEVVFKFYNKVGIKSPRTKNITKHIGWSFLFQGGSIIANFLIVPLTINYLSTANYGIWLTLSSFIAWFSFFDIGLGHGLRNKFAEAKAREDFELAKHYVSTAYFTLMVIGGISIILFFIFNSFINWKNVLNVNPAMSKELAILMPVVFTFFCLQLVAKLITTIYTADQNHSMQGKIGFFTSLISLLIVWILTHNENGSLLLFGIVFSSLPVLILSLLNFYGFSTRYRIFRPSFTYFKTKYLKELFGLGMNFFIIQITMIIIFSTDNILITRIFGPEDVVPYSISFKYMGLSNMIFLLILTPYWSSVTDAYFRKDINWIKKSMQNLIYISLGFVFLIICMIFLSSAFYSFWVGDKVFIPIRLTISMAVYYAVLISYAPFNYFLNGIGKIKLHMYAFIIGAIFNIPLSIVLAKNLDYGISGVIIASMLCLLPQAILCPIQYFKIMNKKAAGVWNR